MCFLAGLHVFFLFRTPFLLKVSDMFASALQVLFWKSCMSSRVFLWVCVAPPSHVSGLGWRSHFLFLKQVQSVSNVAIKSSEWFAMCVLLIVRRRIRPSCVLNRWYFDRAVRTLMVQKLHAMCKNPFHLCAPCVVCGSHRTDSSTPSVRSKSFRHVLPDSFHLSSHEGAFDDLSVASSRR